MASKVCMNGFCQATSSVKWRKGWDLRFGGVATLCDKCGFAYEQLVFCDTFHVKESGWRDCSSCGKRLHCGCTASKSLFELLDNGGVECLGCMKRLHSSMPSDEKPNGFGKEENYSNGIGNILQMGKNTEGNEHINLLQYLKNDTNGSLCQMKIEQGMRSVKEVDCKKPPVVARPEAANSMLSQLRIGRLPEGRGRSQMLPRYWPKITEEELQQISENSNSKIVPLFEKVLTASDASRIGRLVLPKACAEAYFPRLLQPEGRPLKIQDAKGNDWGFQFRFWPNNNSRMYVLEGVAPCMQSMQLKAGDTITFSRIDPEGKLMVGSRKASSSGPQHITQSDSYTTIRSQDCGNSYNGVPEDLNPKKLENLLSLNMNFKKRRSAGGEKANKKHDPDFSLDNIKRRRIVESEKTDEDYEPFSGLETLAATAVLEENLGELDTAFLTTANEHPQHHPGCRCTICIKPPSRRGPKKNPADIV
ncbi:B3 domain-containing transcription repressor VAL2-like [Papaver somniferum]|uniref:B3 domain-containing transcription repressor VAL2-like n=1 Tax=Papaver somniferum TaxID=3469 RepID=UPI000E6F604C|nr:B3 domain-containing transcription repressor VAL2-like [Papaver somniferum]XP_026446351.1 B3 domain-containing transcription repressor VAL2-like [Papaver somniferum]